MKTEDKENDIEVQCICGKLCIRVKAEDCYESAGGVRCDECARSVKSGNMVYHCSNQRTRIHPRGYDICSKCALDEVTIMPTDKVKPKRKINASFLVAFVLVLYGVSILATIGIALGGSYQSGRIEYQYIITTPNQTAIFPLQNSFECDLNKISIVCDDSINAGNLDGHDLCDLLTTRNSNNDYEFSRIDANPQYNTFNGATFWMLIVFGLQIPFAIVLLYLYHFFFKNLCKYGYGYHY